MKISLIFNNNNWTTIDQKVKNICAFFMPAVTLEPTILKTSFNNIQWEKVKTLDGTGYQDGTSVTGQADTVANAWYDQNILPLCIGAEIIVFCVSNSDKVGHPLCPTGIRGDNNEGPVECIIFGQNENDRVYVNGVDIGNDFEIFAEHEISHALYMIDGKKDNTHLYFYSGVPAKVLPELKNTQTNKFVFLTKLINFLKTLLSSLLNQQKTVQPTPQPIPQNPPVPEVLLWDKANARHSVRVMCDNAGLPLTRTVNIDGKMYLAKDVICACIEQESHFDNNVKPCENKDPKTGEVWSRDYGICQINDYYHVIKFHDFPSVDFILQNPDKAVQYMIDCFKGGRINQWSSYSTGAFKKYLP